MAETVTSTIARGDFSSRLLRLDTLVRLRWLAVAGQAAAVLFVRAALDFPLPTELCFVVIGLSAALNIALRARYPATLRLGQWPATALLAYDVIQLGALLYLTGGLENPFSILLLVPVIVSATTLPPRPTIALGVMVVAAASLLIVNHLPLPLPNGGPALPLIYVGGVWVALVSACVFTGVYAFRVAEEARQLAKALNATEMVLAREQHLYALDGLAAAAAHELGTPLATIALVAKELSREMPPGSPHADDVALLSSQSQRCRDILARLTSMSGQVDDHHLSRLPLSHLVEEVVEAYRAFAAEIVVTPPKGKGPEPVGRRNPAIVQGLVNLVENAVDFADERVTVGSQWSEREVMITIADDGPGFSAAIIDRLGEPYITTRRDAAPAAPGEADHEAGGLGLGLFIAKTLLERSGATLDLANRSPPEKGAVIRVAWPRARMDTAMDAAGTEAETIAAGAAWRKAAETL